MRRLIGLVLASTLVLATLLPLSAASATPASTDTLAETAAVLALEAEPGAEAPGPEPAPPNATDNPAAPDEYERPWIWAVSVILLAAAVIGLAVGGGLYWLLVVRPRQSASTSTT